MAVLWWILDDMPRVKFLISDFSFYFPPLTKLKIHICFLDFFIFSNHSMASSAQPAPASSSAAPQPQPQPRGGAPNLSRLFATTPISGGGAAGDTFVGGGGLTRTKSAGVSRSAAAPSSYTAATGGPGGARTSTREQRRDEGALDGRFVVALIENRAREVGVAAFDLDTNSAHLHQYVEASPAMHVTTLHLLKL